MSGVRRTTGELVDDLVWDLRPVRRFPSLSWALLGVIAVWGTAAVLLWQLYQPSFVEVGLRLLDEPVFCLVWLGLAVAAIAGSAAAIGGAVPGRASVERGGRLAATGGLGLAFSVGALATAFGTVPGITPVDRDVACFVLGALVGVPPAVVLVLLVRWGYVQHPPRSATLVVLGAFGLGALAVQIGCHYPGARHMWIGHVGIPVAMLLLAAWPIQRMLARRVARRHPPG